MEGKDEILKERCMEIYRKEKRSIKSWISYLCGKKINDQFEREMNQDVNRSRKLFWKEASKVNGGKLQ